MSSVHSTPPPSARSSRTKRPHSRGSSSLPTSPPLSLQAVLGHTSHSPFSHSLSPTTGELAYIAGNSLLLYSHRTHSTHLLTTTRPSHTLTSTSFSPDGSLLALGESGTSPCLLIVDANTGERRAAIHNLHAHSIRCIRWHPTLPSLLLTLGEGDPAHPPSTLTAAVSAPFTSELAMLDWRAGDDRASTLLFSTTLDEPVHGLSISEDGTYAVTCGERSLTYWHLTVHQDDSSSSLSALDGRRLSVERQDAKLGVHRQATFVSLACGLGPTSSYTFALTNRGVLCAFTQKDRKKAAASPSPTAARSFAWEIEKWVDLRLDTGYDLTIAATPGASLLAMGGAEGKVRLFEPEGLQHIATLPRPPPYIHTASSLPTPPSTPSLTPSPPTPTPPGTYPPTLSLSLFPDLSKLVAFYADRSLVVWDIRQPKERPIGVLRSFVGHGGCIWDVTSVERRKAGVGGVVGGGKGEEEVKEQEGDGERKGVVPDHTIVTCGADNSLRFWHLNRDAVAQAKLSAGDKTRWTDQQLACIHVTDTAPPSSSSSVPSSASGAGVKVVLALVSYTSVPSRADLLVTGDKQGVIRLFSLSSLTPLTSAHASDKEIKALDYHAARDTLIVGTRDGHVHLLDLSTLPNPPTVSTLPLAHSAAISGVKVTSRGLLITASADRSIIFHLAPSSSTTLPTSASSPSSPPTPSLHPSYPQVSRTVLKTGTPHSLLLHPSERFVAVATSDRWLRIFDLSTYKETRQYRVECGAGGEMTAMAVDDGGTFIAVGCSDKAVYVVEWFSGAVMGALLGHGSVVTGVAWVEDSSQLVSVGADGCVFVWKVDDRWRAVIKEAARRAKRSSLNASSSSSSSVAAAAGAGGGLNSARRRRSALDYLDDEAEVTGESVATTATRDELAGSSELDLLDEDDREERKGGGSVVHSPPQRPRPAVVPPLALPLASEEHKERGAEREYQPATAPDWAKTQSQAVTAAMSTPASSSSSPSSAAVVASPPQTGREPRTSRWSLRAQAGYKMVSELDREGVDVTPSTALERREKLGDTDPASKEDEAQHTRQAPPGGEQTAGEVIEEELPTEGGAVVTTAQSEEPPSIARGRVAREAESEEVEEQLQTESPVKREALSVVSPASSSPPLPPRPTLALLRSPAHAAEDGRGGQPSPLVHSLAAALAVPSLAASAASAPSTSVTTSASSSSSNPPSAANSPSLPPRRASLPPSRSSSRPTSPFMKAIASPPHPTRTLLPSSIPEAAVDPFSDAAAALQSLQSQLTRTLALYAQVKLPHTTQTSSSSASLASLELGLLSLHDQLDQALPSSRAQEAAPSAAAVDVLEMLGGGQVVGKALDRYSDLLVELVVKKLQGTAEASAQRSAGG